MSITHQVSPFLAMPALLLSYWRQRSNSRRWLNSMICSPLTMNSHNHSLFRAPPHKLNLRMFIDIGNQTGGSLVNFRRFLCSVTSNRIHALRGVEQHYPSRRSMRNFSTSCTASCSYDHLPVPTAGLNNRYQQFVNTHGRNSKQFFLSYKKN